MNPKTILTFIGVIFISCTVSANNQKNENLDAFCKLLSNDVKKDVEVLIRKFGDPSKVNIDYYPNKHIDDATDEVHTAKFGNGLVAIYSVPAIERNYILRIELSSEFWPENLPRYIARSSKEVEYIFGAPDKSNENSLQYYCAIESTNYIQFVFEADRVVKLRAQKWID